MPHQAVIRENKETTKLRVVFDASSHAENCLSLNDCLHSGPKMCPDILELLLKFRQNRIAFTADIEQAFLQISLADEDRNAVKFLWNDGELNGTKIKALRMTRVIFGATSSPFLLRATLNVHADKYKLQYPNVFSMLTENMYVDDLIAGADEESEAFEESEHIKRILKEGGFNMRKWKTNETNLQRVWNEEDFSHDSTCSKVLGYIWNRSNDTFFDRN
ncbi:uncharacterized protein LOC118203124 [Stegodyphus dumicola]|uniref:uncharacterized protein LOC118203124 n=1 Tax=Stegodyphus dumicola TaxID=202533 RepID=UPI0015A9B434|nr:uncharacterized protein LOC118203124 [Stegodyphus dumicola]